MATKILHDDCTKTQADYRIRRGQDRKWLATTGSYVFWVEHRDDAWAFSSSQEAAEAITKCGSPRILIDTPKTDLVIE